MWWKDAVVYQVYPASFKDSDGDGLGDIPGLISKLDYLKDLGIDVVWLSPMYKSPQVDMGYDISDYEDIHAPFGCLADMDELTHGLHQRGMRLILDLVINHTSCQHAWFQESRSSKDNPKRDWYIWRQPRYDASGNRHPPNNWRASFGGSVWEWDEKTQEYYLHYFAPEQPDLNWDNEETRKAIYDSAVRFWLEKGVDGFRIDTVNKYSKPAEFVNAPVTEPGSAWQYAYPLFCNGPKMHDFLKEMVRDAMDPFGEVMTVGELPCTPDAKEILRYVSARERELNMVFHFDMVYLGMGTVWKYIPEPFDLRDVKTALGKWQRFIQGTDMWTTVFAENHDSARSITRFASDAPEHREASAKLLALMLTTLTGTLFIYQGQEIGMVNVPREWPVEEYKDLETQNFYARMKDSTGNDPKEMNAAMDGIAYLARDHARTPMQWDDSENGGFSTGKPWMRVHDNYREVNVQKQLGEHDSPLMFWKHLISFRKQYHSLFTHGLFTEYGHDNTALFTYTKTLDNCAVSSTNGESMETIETKALISLNFSNSCKKVYLPEDCKAATIELAISTKDGKVESDTLGPYEGRVYWVR
ncbi:probable alpha-amylase [Cephalotrichum gorgonifer]|uniref:Probable alpha-amylase n=1 Tax=Cephalotrichum gorgonifer TaxID=2041049 RepID=A0AAE8N295_9PEZI|nr:probable alpha-amylase [Cephalotrichum gorgonifer]